MVGFSEDTDLLSLANLRKALPFIIPLLLLIAIVIGILSTRDKEEEVVVNDPVQLDENSLSFGAVVDNLKGVDMSGLSEDQRDRSLRLLNIVNCLASNSRMSVARCRRDVPHCVTSQRMADYIINTVNKGLSNEFILKQLYEKALSEGGAIARLDDNRKKLSNGKLPSLGPPDAPVQVTLFYDYTSSFSHHAWEEVVALHHLYPNKVRVVLWPMPRSRLDSRAEKAARVALAAHKVRKFDVVHPLLLLSAGEIGGGRLDKYNEAAGLEQDMLNNVAISTEIRSQMSRLQNKAERLGIYSSPVVFVAGRKVHGAVPSTCMLVGAVQEALVEVLTGEYDELSIRIAPM